MDGEEKRADTKARWAVLLVNAALLLAFMLLLAWWPAGN